METFFSNLLDHAVMMSGSRQAHSSCVALVLLELLSTLRRNGPASSCVPHGVYKCCVCSLRDRTYRFRSSSTLLIQKEQQHPHHQRDVSLAQQQQQQFGCESNSNNNSSDSSTQVGGCLHLHSVGANHVMLCIMCLLLAPCVVRGECVCLPWCRHNPEAICM